MLQHKEFKSRGEKSRGICVAQLLLGASRRRSVPVKDSKAFGSGHREQNAAEPGYPTEVSRAA